MKRPPPRPKTGFPYLQRTETVFKWRQRGQVRGGAVAQSCFSPQAASPCRMAALQSVLVPQSFCPENIGVLSEEPIGRL